MEEAKPYKLGHQFNDEFVPFQHNHTWARQATSDGAVRLRIGPRDGHVDLMLELARTLPEPFCILYVLLIPSGQFEVGRYQSPLTTLENVERVFGVFRSIFENDGRAEVWLASVARGGEANGTIDYDNHELIYAYGPLEPF
ncbi:MAG: hypothetical protein ABL949_11595 [Fimbriimonadaceae bacterium]